METILKEGYEKILEIFYGDKSAKVHLREIARKARLNENSASRFLKKLERGKILMPKKDANLKKYELMKNDTVYSILSFFDITRFSRLPTIRRNAIQLFLDSLEEKPIIAFLFGSTAKGTYSEHSDIDLLFVVNRQIATKEAERYADAQAAQKISCIQITLKEFEEELKLKQDKVVQSALKSGFPITNHIEYYRRVYDERI